MPSRPAAPVDFAALQRRLDEAEASLAGQASPAERQAILAERGRAIAAARQAARPEQLPVLAFSVGGARLAVEVEAVAQVIDARGLQPLVAAPAWLLGAVVARGRVVPVLDLRPLLGLAGGGLSDLTRVVVVEEAGDAFGLAVEALEGRVEVAREGLAAAAGGPYRWVAADGLALLDLARLGAAEAG